MDPKLIKAIESLNEPNWTAVVTALATGFGLLVIIAQIHGLKQQLQSSAFNSYWPLLVGLDKWFAENPLLRPYFYSGTDIDASTSDEMKMKLESTAEMMLDTFASTYHQLKIVPRGERERVAKYFKDVYHGQPVFQRHVNKYCDWYDPKFIKFLTSK